MNFGGNSEIAFGASATAFILLLPANSLPLARVTELGQSLQGTLAAGPLVLWRQGWPVLALLVGVFAVILPVLRFGLLAAVLGLLQIGALPRWIGPAFRWAMRLQRWSMPDVFLIGAAVGYSRLVAYVSVHIEAGGWCLAAAALLAMVADAALDQRMVWLNIAPDPPHARQPEKACGSCLAVVGAEAGTHRCPRCGDRVSPRKPRSQSRTAALIATGFLLYGPANIYPMTAIVRINGTQEHTILGGIASLAEARLWPLAAIVFCTSILIPILKLIGLRWLVVSSGSTKALRLRTGLYRVIDGIGRWSAVDVFTIAAFAPLLQFSVTTAVQAGVGAVFFILVVVVTMLAARSFDAQLMWDATEDSREPNA